MLTTFDKIFPAPAFLRMPAVGLDISDDVIRYVKIKNTNNGLGVDVFGQKQIPEGVIKDGVILDAEKMAGLLVDVQKESKASFAHVSIPEGLVYGFTIDIPKLDKSKIRGAIDFQIEEHVPAQKEELIFDYSILSEGVRTYKVKVNAVLRKTFKSYDDLIKKGGFILAVFEPEPEAVWRALLPDDKQQDLILVDVGVLRTSVSIIEKGKIVSSSSVPFEGGSLSGSTDVEGVEGSVSMGGVKLLNNEIQKYYHYWKRQNKTRAARFEEEASSDKKQEARTNKINEVLTNDGSEQEKNKMENAVDSKQDQDVPEKKLTIIEKENGGVEGGIAYPIILSGRTADLAGLPEKMTRALGSSVSFAKIWNAPGVKKRDHEIPDNNLLSYATAIGLALSDFYHD